MPLIPTTPEVRLIPGPAEERALDRMHLVSFKFVSDVNAPANSHVEVEWRVGYDHPTDTITDADGTRPRFQEVERKRARLSGPAVQAAVAAAPQGTSIFDATRNAVWSLLISEGHVEGSVV